MSRLELHHVGIVVSDLDAAVAAYERLGFAGGERWEMPQQQIVAVTYPSGAGWVELITPTDPEGPIARFLEKRGDTMHHVAYRTHDLEGELARLKDAGVRLIDETPRIGTHGWRIAFLHPESCNGVLTELLDDRP
ncbi:MAG: methylmalonyl-CoA epimerase [Thermomicrobiales bacterium]|nr:methylmalonyl-CoA epimerase [Thermomicrobiales bacterium]MCO5220580.1 methylmalonyl-CoA epimerase [Thermomicrobiales bacterium]